MDAEGIDWRQWSEFFGNRKDRAVPDLDACDLYTNLPASLTQSLAIFQLGESGGGTIIDQARNSCIKAIDHDYADAMALFVAEEHRHADILASCVSHLFGYRVNHATAHSEPRRLRHRAILSPWRMVSWAKEHGTSLNRDSTLPVFGVYVLNLVPAGLRGIVSTLRPVGMVATTRSNVSRTIWR